MMKTILIIWLALTAFSQAAPRMHEDVYGKFLGGWDAKKGRAADYEISGSSYCTWKPEVTPLITGGLFISVRIDYLRGVFASDDHASLEITVDKNGHVISARSSLALQGKRVTSDIIRTSGKLGAKAVGIEASASIGVNLVADLTAKIMREKITEPGRVTFPSVIQHNYNYLCLSIGNDKQKAVAIKEKGKPKKKADPPKAQVDPPEKQADTQKPTEPLNVEEERKLVPVKIEPANVIPPVKVEE